MGQEIGFLRGESQKTDETTRHIAMQLEKFEQYDLAFLEKIKKEVRTLEQLSERISLIEEEFDRLIELERNYSEHLTQMQRLESEQRVARTKIDSLFQKSEIFMGLIQRKVSIILDQIYHLQRCQDDLVHEYDLDGEKFKELTKSAHEIRDLTTALVGRVNKSAQLMHESREKVLEKAKIGF